MEEAEARKARLKDLRAKAENSQKDDLLMKEQQLPPPNFSNSLINSHNNTYINSNNNSNDNSSEVLISNPQSPKFNFYTNPMAGYTRSNGRGRTGMGVTPQASVDPSFGSSSLGPPSLGSPFVVSYNNSGTRTDQWNQRQPGIESSMQYQNQSIPHQNQWYSGAPPVQNMSQQGVLSHPTVHNQRSYGSPVEPCQTQYHNQSFQRQGFSQGQGQGQGQGFSQQGQGFSQRGQGFSQQGQGYSYQGQGFTKGQGFSQGQGSSQRQGFTQGQGFSGSSGNNVEAKQRANGQKWQLGQGRGRIEGKTVGVGVVDTDSGSFRGTKARRYGEACARERPDLYYSKSMVEDPWKGL